MDSKQKRAFIAQNEANMPDSEAYVHAHLFLKRLGEWKQVMPKNLMLTLRGQALHGDLAGAEKGLRGWVQNNAR